MKTSTGITTLLCAATATALAVTIATPVASARPQAKQLLGTYVIPFQRPDSPSGSSTALQGIKGADTKGSYYIVGTNWPDGLVYNGPINEGATTGDSGSWTIMNLPASWNAAVTSIYGVDNLRGQDVQLVGSYNTGNISQNGVQSFFYEGPVTATPDPNSFSSFAAVNPKNGATADFTFLHSVSGGLVVGNYDFAGDKNPAGNAFLYNPDSGKQTSIVYPKKQRSFTHTAYGIWWNGGYSYTISGGASRDHSITKGHDGDPLGVGTLIDYNSRSGRFSHYRKFSYPAKKNKKAPITHFEGIWSNGTGTYRMPVTTVTSKGAVGAVATVKRAEDGSFGTVSWKLLDVTGSDTLTTNNSIFNKASVGVSDIGGSVEPYAFLAK
jgi:hypothetical protein